jgi:hypothetical protein
VVLKSAFRGRTKRDKRQILVQLQINNMLLEQIILISSQFVTPLLLGIDACIDIHIICFPKKTIIIKADDEENATEVNLVNETQNSNSGIDSRTIDPGTADPPPTPHLDRMVNPSIFRPSYPTIKRKTSRRIPVP